MYFADFKELMNLIAMWLQGFWMASKVAGVHEDPLDPDLEAKVVDLMARARALEADGFANSERVTKWLHDLGDIAPLLWD